MLRSSPAAMSFRLALAGTIILLTLAAGCSSDFSVPQEAQLGCKNEGDCPSGWACNANIGRCVKTENLDSSSPALVGEVTVTPPVLRKGATAVVTFEVSEELSAPPRRRGEGRRARCERCRGARRHARRGERRG